jgi:alkanesulfonate monooxygenase SsuD/methylene tetrahydromethanopterin reductase-like flavin-dependent oxidoreductase (luciferase family)
MRIGVSLTSSHRVLDPREGARRMIDRARVAREVGLDSLFVGDHHVTPEPYFQNVAILGRLLAEWGDRRAGALFLLPLWHPVLLAEQVSTLAAVARGRFVLQCGLGYGEEQFRGLGVDSRQRPSRFEQSLGILRRLWAGETVSHRGRWTFEGARIAPLPPEPIAVWVGASAGPAIERAARLGDGWIASPALTFDQARAQIEQYEKACQACGRAPGARIIRRDVYVGATTSEAQRIAEPVLASGHRGFPSSAVVFGDAEAVAKSFGELADMGYEEVLVRSLVPDPQQALDSFARLARVKELLARR